MNIYVGNLAYSVTEDELRTTFSEFGTVTRATVITDRATGQSKGFGFVEMSSGAEAAIQNLNGKPMSGRPLKVNEARPREERPARAARW
jgi:RNA recognition motif-containing protein